MHELWSHLVFGPTIFKMITDIILAPFPPSRDTIERAIERVQMDLEHLQMWAGLLQERQSSEEDEGANVRAFPSQTSESAGDRSMQRIPWQVLQGTYTMCVMLKRRLLTSLAPNRFRNVEVQCQTLADIVINTSASSSFDSISSGLFTAQTVWIAQSIVATKSMWCENAADCLHGRDQAERNEGMI